MREVRKKVSVSLGFQIFCFILNSFSPLFLPTKERRLAHRTTWNTNGCAFVIHETRFGFNSSRRRRSVRRCSGGAIAIAIAIATTTTTLWHRGGRGGERGRIADGGAIARFESKEKSNRESDGLFDWTVSVGRVVDIRIWDGFWAQGGDFGAVADGE